MLRNGLIPMDESLIERALNLWKSVEAFSASSSHTQGEPALDKLLVQIDPEASKSLAIPLHEGAARYFGG